MAAAPASLRETAGYHPEKAVSLPPASGGLFFTRSQCCDRPVSQPVSSFYYAPRDECQSQASARRFGASSTAMTRSGARQPPTLADWGTPTSSQWLRLGHRERLQNMKLNTGVSERSRIRLSLNKLLKPSGKAHPTTGTIPQQAAAKGSPLPMP